MNKPTPELSRALAGAFTDAELELLAGYLTPRAREARATHRLDAERALTRLERAVLDARETT